MTFKSYLHSEVIQKLLGLNKDGQTEQRENICPGDRISLKTKKAN